MINVIFVGVFSVSSVAVVALMLSSLSACNCVLSTDLPSYRNFPHTCCMCFRCSGVNSGDVSSVLYCIFFPDLGDTYLVGP